MTNIDDQGRPEPPVAADELATLLGFLDFQRATLEWKCRGLCAADMLATVGASTMTLGGLVKHMAYVEDYWFNDRLLDRPRQAPWSTVDWAVDRDWEFTSSVHDTPEELFALWRAAVQRSRNALELALSHGGLDQPARRPWDDGTAPSLRWILVHMIEEYARHNGHADLLRESVDGEVGE